MLCYTIAIYAYAIHVRMLVSTHVCRERERKKERNVYDNDERKERKKSEKKSTECSNKR